MGWSPPQQSDVFTAMDATWSPARTSECDGWLIREGRGGGQRVSAASLVGADASIPAAEQAMKFLGQTPLFMIRHGDREPDQEPDQALDQALDQPLDQPLDQELASLGYRIKDPVVLMAADAKQLGAYDPKNIDVIECDDPLPILAEIWARGGINLSRLAVMRRSVKPQVCLMGRQEGRAVGAGFVALSKGIVVVHALEILLHIRRSGLGTKMMGRAAVWGAEQGAHTLAVAVTEANGPAIGLYKALGMVPVGRYHYRINDATGE